MSDLARMDDDDVTAMQPIVRRHNTTKLRTLIDSLEPYVDGSYGPINPRMVEVYMRALRELAQLWRTYDPPRTVEAPEEEQAPALRMQAIQAQVLRQLEDLSKKNPARNRQVNGS